MWASQVLNWPAESHSLPNSSKPNPSQGKHTSWLSILVFDFYAAWLASIFLSASLLSYPVLSQTYFYLLVDGVTLCHCWRELTTATHKTKGERHQTLSSPTPPLLSIGDRTVVPQRLPVPTHSRRANSGMLGLHLQTQIPMSFYFLMVFPRGINYNSPLPRRRVVSLLLNQSRVHFPKSSNAFPGKFQV